MKFHNSRALNDSLRILYELVDQIEYASEYRAPVNWLYVAFVGLYLDVVKSPGYILGSIFKALNFKTLIKRKYPSKQSEDY